MNERIYWAFFNKILPESPKECSAQKSTHRIGKENSKKRTSLAKEINIRNWIISKISLGSFLTNYCSAHTAIEESKPATSMAHPLGTNFEFSTSSEISALKFALKMQSLEGSQLLSRNWNPIVELDRDRKCTV